jgi:glutaredoxin
MTDGADPVIVMYSLPECPHCEEARAWLRGRGLAFEEVDVRSVERVLHQALVHAGRPVVPVLEVGSEVQVGFDAGRLEEMINSAHGRSNL